MVAQGHGGTRPWPCAATTHSSQLFSVYLFEKWVMFDSPSELIEKIHLGEDSTIEFKRELPRRDGLADEIAAFANARGGVILIGVGDDGDIVGLDQQNLNQAEMTVIEICRDSIEPRVPIFAEKLRLDEKFLLKIDVPHGLFIHKTSGGYFIRQGSSKIEMPKEYLARLLQSRREWALSLSRSSLYRTPPGAPCETTFANVFSL